MNAISLIAILSLVYKIISIKSTCFHQSNALFQKESLFLRVDEENTLASKLRSPVLGFAWSRDLAVDP